MLNNTKEWYPTTDRRVSVESCNSGLCQLLFSGFCYDGRWVLFAQMVWIATWHPRRPFLSFLQTLSVFHCGCWRVRTSMCLQEPWEWQSQDSGSEQPRISRLLFSVAPAGQCCFRFWRFTHSDAVPRCALAGWLWGRQGGEPKQWQLLSLCRQQLPFSCAQRHCSL